jgi:cysteine synthase A
LSYNRNLKEKPNRSVSNTKREIKMKYDNILQTIGNTPHVRINLLFRDDIEVWMKMESFNPCSSIKDRIAETMIKDAEEKGLINKDTVIIEPTSGNTGIGTIAKAKELLEQHADGWMPQQFENPANVQAHKESTAPEILADFPDGIDYMITGVGTGGHITGCAEVLKEKFPNLKVFAVEPEKSPVISGGEKGLHRLQGIGAGFIPDVLNVDILDGTIQVSEEDAFEMTRRCAKEEGIFIGISSGATLAALKQKESEMVAGSRVLIFSYDSGERYLSVEDLF